MIKIFRYNSSMQEDVANFITQNMSSELKVQDSKTFEKIVGDLKDIHHNYIESGGELLFAFDIERKEIAGTIAVRYENDLAILKRFYVSPKYRSQKIGLELYLNLEKVMEEKGINKVYLTTGKELQNAHKFYEKNGWKKELDNPGIFCRSGADLYKKEIILRGSDKMDDILSQADILVEAIPYIKEFVGKIIVIKCGTNAITNDEQKENVVRQIALLKMIGMKVVLVHGSDNTVIDNLLLNKELTKMLNAHDCKAIGMSGIDDDTIKCINTDDGYKVDRINPELLNDLIERNYIPVIASMCIDENKDYCIVDSDIAASAIAIELMAKKIIFLTDTNGLMDKNNALISVITHEKLAELVEDGTISGGMIPKVQSCIKCLENGVERTHILNGTKKNTLLYELLSKNGIGTMIV